jgi:His-Xaa-Ser system protein HxsD
MALPAEGGCPAIIIDGTRGVCSLDLRVYSLTAVKKAAYRVAGRCTVAFGEIRGNLLDATILAANSGDVEPCVRAFLDEVLDQDLREQVGGATAQLRDLILAHAYSRTRLVTEG